MKQKLIDALATKFEGVDAKVLGRVADKILKGKTITTDEDVTTAVEGVTFSEILTMYGDSRATEAQQTAVKTYEKKYGLKDGKKVSADDDDDDNDDGHGDDDDTDDGKKKKKKSADEGGDFEKLSAMFAEKFAALEKKFDTIEKGKVTDTRRKRLDKAIEGLTEKQRKPYSRTPIENLSDEEFETLMTDIETEAKELADENSANHSTYSSPFGGSHSSGKAKEATKEEAKEIAEMIC